MNVADALEARLPLHKASLTLTHNEHRDYYETVESWCDQPGDWISLEQRAKAIETDSVWSLQWYPESPVGFHVRHAADLEALLQFVEKMSK